MAIKRYLPKYKKLLRFYTPIQYEKRVKIRKFNKQKWQRVKSFYYPKKLKFFRQDVSSYPLSKYSDIDRVVRLKKTYKNLLLSKQKLQLYYGVGRLKFFQLKNIAKRVKSSTKKGILTSGKALLSFFENRLDVVLYRLSLVNSISYARNLIESGCIKVNSLVVKTPNYLLKPKDVLSFDSFVKDCVYGFYLKHSLPYFFFRYKEDRRDYIEKRKNVWEKSFIEQNLQKSLNKTKNFLFKLKKKKNDSIQN